MRIHPLVSSTSAVMLFVFIAIFACAFANLTTLTRMVWAMARQRQLPASSWLARVRAHHVPANAIWAITLLSAVFVWAKVEIVIIGIATLAGHATYALVAGASLFGRWQERLKDPGAAGKEVTSFETDSPTGRIVPRAQGVVTFLWLLVVMAMLGLPRTAWRNSIATLAAAAVGGTFYCWGRSGNDEL